MPNILIIGASRGLGASLANAYAAQPNTTVFGTTRAAQGPTQGDAHEGVIWVTDIDVAREGVGTRMVERLEKLGCDGGQGFEVVIITAGYFATEDFASGPKWEEEVKMYTTSAIAPPFIVHALFRAKLLPPHSKVLLVSSESGSIALRHEIEGGGNYAHHASKSALNMVGRLLSLDLRDEGVIVSIVHPGFMRTDMTAAVGFDRFWDEGGAVHPEEAAESLIKWAEELDLSKSGEYWAPRGPRDIGTAEAVLGKGLPTPLQLPW